MAATASAREQCPWCDSLITHQKFLEVKERIREEERKQQEQISSQLRTKYEDQLREQSEKLQKANTDRAELEMKHKQELEIAAAGAKKAAEDAAAVKANADQLRMREILEKQNQEKLQSVTEDFAKRLEEAQKKLAEFEAKEGQTEREVDVLEALQTAFEGDTIYGVPTETGDAATIVIDVKVRNTVCGKILIDGRGRKSWQTGYTKKLREQMLDDKAEHAIVASYKLPGDADQICEHNGVLVVHPARIVEIVRILRQSMTKLFQIKATTEQRSEKKSQLYDFITSTSGQEKLKETGSLVKQLQDLHVREKKEHDNIWKQRGEIERKIQKVADGLVEEIHDIVGGSGK